jgi:subtilisin family serine protease
MRNTLSLLAALTACVALAQPRIPANSLADMLRLQKLAAAEPDARKLTEAAQGRYPVAYLNGRCMVGFLAKAAPGWAPVPDEQVQWGARAGDIVSFRADVQHLHRVRELPGLLVAELAGTAAPHLDKVVRAIRADSVQRGINLPQAYTGRNVIIGITDWGFDYTHPMFYDTAMNATRVLAAWDQFKQSGPAPVGFGYGTAYTSAAELLAAGSDTSNIYGHHYHGTHVAGIAGGGGAGTSYRGVAFDAQFLFTTFLIDAAAVLDAFTWMQGIAEQQQKRLVINMSWGLYYMGTLDGHSLISQAIDQLSQQGVLFVTSNGNNGDVPFHIKRDFAGDTLRTRIQFYPYGTNPNLYGQSVSMWGQPGQPFALRMAVTNTSNAVLAQTPWYRTDTQQPFLDSMLVVGTDTVFFDLATDAAHPLNGRSQARLRAKCASALLRVALFATAPSGTVHFWNVTELTTGVGNWGQAFQAPQAGWTAGDAAYGVGEPACTNSVVSVAAYNSEYLTTIGTWAGGAPAAFSSYGPTLDERIKPDIAAPGVNVASSINSYTDAAVTPFTTIQFQGRTYGFARLSGTSMSSPATAGGAALLLEVAPQAEPAEIKAAIRGSARTDSYTGTIPAGGSTRWGMGKLNVYRAATDLLGISQVPFAAAEQVRAWPNPSDDGFTVEGLAGSYTVTDALGRTVAQGRLGAGVQQRIDASAWAPGRYTLRVAAADGVRVAGLLRR